MTMQHDLRGMARVFCLTTRRLPNSGRSCVHDSDTAGSVGKPPTALLSESEKTSIPEEFKKTGSVIQIIRLTDALGMAMDIADIDRVCQLKERASKPQKIGATRRKGRKTASCSSTR